MDSLRSRPRLEMLEDRSVPAADPMFLGINDGDYGYGDAQVPAMFLQDMADTGLKVTRDRVRGNNPDVVAKATAYQNAGIDCHWMLNYRGGGANYNGTTRLDVAGGFTDDPAKFEQWAARYKQRCIDMMTLLRGKAFYYIVGNEPDKLDPDTGYLRPWQAVRMTQMAYEAARFVDPTGAIKVESAPVSAPDVDYLRQMIVDHDLALHCDFVGVHAYRDQIRDSAMAKPWEWQQANGGTAKPAAISEYGATPRHQAPANYPGGPDQFLADWVAKAYVQAKRFGYANVILFESTNVGDPAWQGRWALLRDSNRAVTPLPYNEIRNNFATRGLAGDGFEAASDYRHDWVPSTYWDNAATWSTGFDFRAAGGRTGASSLRIDATRSANPEGTPSVRRVVAVTPGVAVRVTAWAFVSSDRPATLRVLGHNRTDGDAAVTATSTATGTWQRLELVVTPTNPWVVVELAATRTATAGSFVKFDDVSVTPTGTTLFQDDFGGGAGNWSRPTGTWQTGTFAGRISYQKTGTGEGVSLAGSADWTDYTVQARVNLQNAAGGVNILGRVQDATHFYLLGIKRETTGQMVWYLLKNDGGTYTTLATGPVAYTAGTWVTLRMKFQGTSIAAEMSSDGTTWSVLGSATDGRYGSGKIGLRGWGAPTIFDDVLVKSL